MTNNPMKTDPANPGRPATPAAAPAAKPGEVKK